MESIKGCCCIAFLWGNFASIDFRMKLIGGGKEEDMHRHKDAIGEILLSALILLCRSLLVVQTLNWILTVKPCFWNVIFVIDIKSHFTFKNVG